MDYFRQYYGAPTQFANWQKYAGMPTDGSGFQGAAPPASPQTLGVAPPSTFGEMAQQKAGQVMGAVSNIADRFSNAGAQLSQGNVYQAAQAMAPQAPAAPKPLGAPTEQDVYDYMRRVGE